MQFFAIELVNLFWLLVRFLLHQLEFNSEWLIVLEEELLNTTGFKREMSLSTSWQLETLINLEEIFNHTIETLYNKILDGTIDPKRASGIKLNTKIQSFYLYNENM